MTLTSRLAIKNLNDRLLIQSVIMQTLIEVILEEGLIAENDLEIRIRKNLESVKTTLNELRQDSSDIDLEELKGLYFGPVGEA